MEVHLDLLELMKIFFYFHDDDITHLVDLHKNIKGLPL